MNQMSKAMRREYIDKCREVQHNMRIAYSLIAPLRTVLDAAAAAKRQAQAMDEGIRAYDRGGRSSVEGDSPQAWDLRTLAGWLPGQIETANECNERWSMANDNDD